ncbi:prophage tail fiber family protein [Escherichia coli 2845350]|uniref:prophage tail fiber N-terminal domain-containing protein n=1 Tax=Escherichia coli TaxID=562 RepID=UPI0002CC98BA|nr:prophage tail fiber N-terminal domain-containing protein [Escherichia coli]EMW26281.1 prophage tail fiber family protein [Escherichia coli 2845350]
MAAVKISGVLKDGAGKPIQNCTIQLKAKRNSTTVLVNTVASENPDEAGRYSMDVEYGQYSVILLVEGFPPSHAGTITVYEGSSPGTLNDFLGAMTEDDVMPEALRRFQEMVEEAARNAEAASQSAAAAKKSETAAASSKNAAKTSETNAANSAQVAAASQTASANSATAAKKSETNAKNSETAAKTSETNAKSSQTAAKTSETNAKASETAAKNSQVAAAQSESAAAGSATSAAGSATAAANSQKAAKTSETNAKSSQTAAKTSETNAKASETAAANSAQASAASQTAAKASEDAAREYASQAAEPYKYVLQPLPDVWIPFNDSLDMLAGFSPGYKQITVGDDVIKMPSDKVVSFKRASGATYINKSGVLTVAEVDEPRFEREGLLIEGQRTNYFRNSNTPEAWNNTGSVSVESFDSDKGFNYGRITVINENPTAQGYQAIAVNTNDAYTCPAGSYTTISCLTKSDNSWCRARFGKMSDNGAFVFHSDAALDPVTGNVVHGNNVTVTAERVGEWWLFTATLFADAEMIISSRFEILAMPGISIIPNGSTLDIAMPQAEIGSYRTSFIITEGAPGTRSSDMVTIPVRNNIHRLPFSALVEVNKNWDIPPSKSPLIFNVKDYQENGLFTHGFRGNNFSDAGSPFISMGGCNKYVATTQRKIISGFRCGADGDVQAVCNGELSVAAKTTWTSIVPRAVLRIGGQGTNGEYHLFGHIRNLRIWHKELTDAQMGESIK